MEKKNSNKVLKATLIISTIMVLLLSAGLFYQVNVKSKIAEELSEKLSLVENLKKENEFYSKKSNADDLFINYRFDESLKYYDEINLEYNLGGDLLEKRRSNYVEYINNEKRRDSVINSMKNSLVRYQVTIQDNNNKITELLDFQKIQENKYKDEIAKLKLSNKNFQADVLNLQNEITRLNDKDLLKFKNANNKEVIYLGGIKDEKANGKGIGIMPSGAIYEGDWKDNLKHGNGKYKWADGELYDGEFKDDKRNGHGVYNWKNGDKYVGQWKDDRRHGKGILYDKNGKVLFDGIWEKDEFKKEHK